MFFILEPPQTDKFRSNRIPPVMGVVSPAFFWSSASLEWWSCDVDDHHHHFLEFSDVVSKRIFKVGETAAWPTNLCLREPRNGVPQGETLASVRTCRPPFPYPTRVAKIKKTVMSNNLDESFWQIKTFTSIGGFDINQINRLRDADELCIIIYWWAKWARGPWVGSE